MPFSVEEFRDLIQLLEERPEWRADLRRLVLTDELLGLPSLVREPTEAQRRSEERLGRVEEGLVGLRAETELRFREVAEAQLTLTRGVDDLREAVRTQGDPMLTPDDGRRGPQSRVTSRVATGNRPSPISAAWCDRLTRC